LPIRHDWQLRALSANHALLIAASSERITERRLFYEPGRRPPVFLPLAISVFLF
jgi:hypothetical protein